MASLSTSRKLTKPNSSKAFCLSRTLGGVGLRGLESGTLEHKMSTGIGVNPSVETV